MTNICWEKVDRGRYATELHGHILQAIRTEEPYHPGQRPYIAVVDRVPLEPGSWSLAEAKTKAIQHIERQNGRAKAESLFRNGGPKNGTARDPIEEIIEEPEETIEFEPLPEPQAQALEAVMAHLGSPGQLAITGTLNGGDLLNTLNALRSALELLRESADLECTVNLPPILKL
jgi:hypothetical protein